MKLSKKITNSIKNVKEFFNYIFGQVSIHGFAYLVRIGLTLVEKFLWLALIITALYFCIDIALESWDRFETKSTVVSLEKDHYYWNTSLPSLTICPVNRLDRKKFDNYCHYRNIEGELKEDLFIFLETLANSSYINFDNIIASDNIDDLQINPNDYMSLIYNLTSDLTLSINDNTRVRTLNNLEFIHTQQILTEYGICYVTNNFLDNKLSTKYLITGQLPTENIYEKHPGINVYRVRFGNLFDGDITYSFIGFQNAITIFIHSPYETIDIEKNVRFAEDALEFETTSMEIVTVEGFKQSTTVEQRGCRFIGESNLTHYKIYTRRLCIQECRLNLAYSICKCIPHFYPNLIKNRKRVCDYKTLIQCFPRYKTVFMELREKYTHKPVQCNCLPNCEDSNVFVEKVQVMGESKDLLGSIGGLIIVKKYPLIRFKRQILFTFTDLLVSIGGTAGFLLGFSVLGAVEFIYFFTLRLWWFIKGHK